MAKLIVKKQAGSSQIVNENGYYLMNIKSVEETVPSRADNAPWDDVLKQRQFLLESNGIFCSAWAQEIGFKSKADYASGEAPEGSKFLCSDGYNENYEVDIASNKRVISSDKSTKALEMLGGLIFGAVPEMDATELDTDTFDFGGLVDKQIGIKVKMIENNKGEFKPKVVEFLTADEVSEKIAELEDEIAE